MTDPNVSRLVIDTSSRGGGAAILDTLADDRDDPTRPATAPYDVRHLEGDFWQRPSLAHIYNTALGRMCAPWAVLAYSVVRALSKVSPALKLPPLIGGPGSLNYYAVVVAGSGGGKSAAGDVAAELVPGDIHIAHLGSGEGFLEAFAGDPTDLDGDSPGPGSQRRMFVTDESDQAAAVGGRSGSTLFPVLRSGWTGSAIGFGYRGRNKRSLAAHSYRATLVMAMQHTRGGWLLADADGGTPQRFGWFPTGDLRISLEAACDDTIRQLPLLADHELARAAGIVKVPDEAKQMIREAHVARQRGDGAALDGHALFCREKFAYGLAILDGRDTMTADDWRLAGTASAVSDHTRAWVAAAVAGQAEAEARDRGHLAGVAQDAAATKRIALSEARDARIARNALAKITEAGFAGIPGRELRPLIAQRDRVYLDGVLEQLQQAGRIGREGARWYATHGGEQ